MAIIATLLDTRSALASLRRSTPRLAATLRACRTSAAFFKLIETQFIDAAVLGIRAAQAIDLGKLRERFPIIPVVVYGPVRSDHGPLLHQLQAHGVVAVAIEGVDDPVVSELVRRSGYLARRRAELAHLPRSLRLTEPLQRRALDRLLAQVGVPLSADGLARGLGISREHLSRQFAAGGAPNLKRVVDLLQLLVVHDLLGCPGYSHSTVAEWLGFSDESHLRVVVRRLTRLPLRDFRSASGAEIQRRFVAAGTRSRGGLRMDR